MLTVHWGVCITRERRRRPRGGDCSRLVGSRWSKWELW